MTQALITINAVPGSNGDLPIDTLVTLGNVGNGGELTYAWSILEQPPGTTNNLSSPTAPGPTFTPTKEGSYLIQLIVNVGLPDEKRDTVIAAVLQLKTRTRVPAAGEEDELSSTQGWSLAANELLRLVDTLRAKPWLCVAELGFGATAGNVVAFSGVSTIKLGLPGQETVPIVTLSTGLTAGLTAGSVGVVQAAVDGGALTSGKLAYINLTGLVAGVTVPALTALGTPLYVSDAGIMSVTPGTNSRRVGRLVALSGTSGTVYLDGSTDSPTAATPTLDDVMVSGTPDNEVVVPDADPLRLYGGLGAMLEVLPITDDVLLTGRRVRLKGGRTAGSGDVNISTFDQGGATDVDPVVVQGGGAVDGSGGSVFASAGAATGTGDGGEVSIEGGNCSDPGSQAGPVTITAGRNDGTGERTPITLIGGRTVVESDSTTSGPLTWRQGVRLSGASSVDVMAGNGDPNGIVTAVRGSLFLDHSNGFLWVNEDSATLWNRMTPSDILWQWNGTNTSQFLGAVDLGVGAAIAGLTLTTAAGGPNGTLLRLQSTELADGGVMFPIDFSFPRRYVVEIVYREFNFTDVTNSGRNIAGLVPISDAACANVQIFGHFNISAVNDQQYIGDIALSSGTPFGPALVFNAQSAAQWCTTFGSVPCSPTKFRQSIKPQ